MKNCNSAIFEAQFEVKIFRKCLIVYFSLIKVQIIWRNINIDREFIRGSGGRYKKKNRVKWFLGHPAEPPVAKLYLRITPLVLYQH